jgi:hypothetical protein
MFKRVTFFSNQITISLYVETVDTQEGGVTEKAAPSEASEF